MAKQNKEVKKKSLNFLDFLKYLTNYLKNKNRNTEQIIKIIDKYDVDKSFLIKRALSYNYNKPHIIWYVNKYLNNKFEFYQYDIYEYLLNLTFIMDQHNHTKLFYLKSKDLKDPNKYQVKKTLKEYYLMVKQKYQNDDELNYLYSLFCQKLITVKEIENMYMALNGPKQKIKLDLNFLENNTFKEDNNTKNKNDKEAIEEYIQYIETSPLPKEIYEFCDEIKNERITRSKCHDCKLSDSSMIVLDTNRETVGPVDFMFISLNPGRNELLYNKPMVGNSGRLQREKMYHLDNNITWVITNIILCATNSQKEIGKTDKQIMDVCHNCQDFLYKIIKNFPAKVYIPIGKQAIEFFGITGSVTQNSGQVSKKENGSIIIPMIHPSAVLKNENINSPIYNNAWNVIYQVATKLIQKKKSKETNAVETIHQEIKTQPQTNTNKKLDKDPIQGNNIYNLPADKCVSIIDDSLTYFDSINLDNQNILNVYIDKTGEKKYKIESFHVPIYVKNCELKDREMLSDNFDYVSYVDGRTRYRLSKTLKDNLIKHKQQSIQRG